MSQGFRKIVKVEVLMFCLVLISLQSFQNCAPSGFQTLDMSSMSSSSLTGSSIDHPGNAIAQPTSQKGVIANRIYVANLLLDVFGGFQFNINVVSSLILNNPTLFGHPCDEKAGIGCTFSPIVPMSVSGDTLRSASKMQACLILTSNDEGLNHLLSQVDPNYSVMTPHQTNIPKLLDLFYRGDDHAPELIDALVLADRAGVKKNSAMSVQDRWRVLVLAVCESSGWESL